MYGSQQRWGAGPVRRGGAQRTPRNAHRNAAAVWVRRFAPAVCQRADVQCVGTRVQVCMSVSESSIGNRMVRSRMCGGMRHAHLRRVARKKVHRPLCFHERELLETCLSNETLASKGIYSTGSRLSRASAVTTRTCYHKSIPSTHPRLQSIGGA